MKLSTYTGLVIGPLMIGCGITILTSLMRGNTMFTNNREIALIMAAGFGVYGLYRLVRSIIALVNRGKEEHQ